MPSPTEETELNIESRKSGIGGTDHPKESDDGDTRSNQPRPSSDQNEKNNKIAKDSKGGSKDVFSDIKNRTADVTNTTRKDKGQSAITRRPYVGITAIHEHPRHKIIENETCLQAGGFIVL